MNIKSMSHCQGKGSLSHNNRTFTPKNVDPERTKDNVTFVRQPIAEAYEQCFGLAVERYNAKQKRDDRRIKTSYFENTFNHLPDNHVITAPDKRKSFYEDLVQIGDKSDSGYGTPDYRLVADCLIEYMKGFSERNPNFYVFNSVLHMDEATPHLHIDYIPVGHYKRGVGTQNGLSQALKEMGYTGIDAINKWRIAERKVLEKICNARGIVIKEPEKSRGSFAVDEYKKYKDNINSLQEQTEFQQDYVEYLDNRIEETTENFERLLNKKFDLEDKNVELYKNISENTTLLSEQERRIQEDKTELEKIAKKKADVKAVEEIEVKNIPLSKNIAVKKSDYDNLQTLAQKQIASEKSEKKLKAEVSELKQKNQVLCSENSALKKKLSEKQSINLTLENASLKQKIGSLENALEKLHAFVEMLGLSEKLQQFLHPHIEKKKKSMSR